MSDNTKPVVISNCATKIALYTQTLLPTAKIRIHNKEGNSHVESFAPFFFNCEY